jgi:UDP-N-acetylmuramoyl-L-alanyl-D-glutamate--2,6-diaminopimelate ligase
MSTLKAFFAQDWPKMDIPLLQGALSNNNGKNMANKKHSMMLKTLLEKWLIVPEMANVEITGLSLNSKTLKRGDLFFAYPGTQQDGRAYIESAIEKGAAAIVAEASLGVSENLTSVDKQGRMVPVLTIPDLAGDCSAIASEFYGNPSQKMRVIGITGTNGKTSCTYYLAAAFTALGTKSAVMGTIGCGVYGQKLEDTGLTTSDAISVQKNLAELLTKKVEIVAMEVSSHALVQGRVNGVHFDRAMFTNLSHDHLDYHGTMREYWRAKKRLFRDFPLKNAIINAKDPYGRKLLLKLWGEQYVCGYSPAPVPAGVSQIPLVTAHDIKFTTQGMQARVQTPWGLGLLSSPQIGRYNLSNLLAVTATMGTMGVHIDDIMDCMKNLPVVPGRMEFIRQKNQPLVVVDYAHTPDALEKVLTVLGEHSVGKIWCVFGCGGTRDSDKRPVMGEIATRLADHVIVTDDNPRLEAPELIVEQIVAGMKHKKKKVIEHDRAKAIAYALKHAAPDDCVLIAGKGHETYQLVGKTRNYFSDVEQVQSILKKRTKSSND